MTEPFDGDLTGKLLIALPEISDAPFARSVILICAHTPEFAMGLIINRPMTHLKIGRLLNQLGHDTPDSLPDRTVLDGGPVAGDRGFVLHSEDVMDERSTLSVKPGICMTATRSLLTAIASDAPPQNYQLMLGYSGWSGGQLESELAVNAWLTCDADERLVFGDAHEEKWTRALARLGIGPGQLQAPGRA
jgi:putative transcriptional regulator